MMEYILIFVLIAAAIVSTGYYISTTSIGWVLHKRRSMRKIYKDIVAYTAMIRAIISMTAFNVMKDSEFMNTINSDMQKFVRCLVDFVVEKKTPDPNGEDSSNKSIISKMMLLVDEALDHDIEKDEDGLIDCVVLNTYRLQDTEFAYQIYNTVKSHGISDMYSWFMMMYSFTVTMNIDRMYLNRILAHIENNMESGKIDIELVKLTDQLNRCITIELCKRTVATIRIGIPPTCDEDYKDNIMKLISSEGFRKVYGDISYNSALELFAQYNNCEPYFNIITGEIIRVLNSQEINYAEVLNERR